MQLRKIGMERTQIEKLNKKGFSSVEAFLRYEPLRYADYSKPYYLEYSTPIIDAIKQGRPVCIIGTCFMVKQTFKNKRSVIRVRVKAQETETVLFITFLNQYKRFEQIQGCLNQEVIVGGILDYSEEYQCFQMLNPEIFSTDITSHQRIYPFYHAMSPLDDNDYREYVSTGEKLISSIDFLPARLLEKYKLPTFKAAVHMIHQPQQIADIDLARKRMVWQDLLYLATKLEIQQKEMIATKGIPFPDTAVMDSYIQSLPYSLTNDQLRAIREISGSMKKGHMENALIQGDVGCGKTTVAFALLLLCASNGYQGALMTPSTELSKQHYQELKEIGDHYGLRVELLTSEIKGKQKKNVLSGLQDGSVHIVIGTQGLISESASFNNLALTILDEEHKFAVLQREKLRNKAAEGAHRVSMSATPIPRTLAETIYGEHVDIQNITSMPNNRIPVQTACCTKYETGLAFIQKQVALGHQAYIIIPSIQGETTSIKNEGAEMVNFFHEHSISAEMIHGKMDKKVVADSMDRFRSGSLSVLISTTIIEVGINVPNATVIMITGAERFGFSTLHQLRGRVGRGKYASYCILQSNKECDRLKFLSDETSGFEIAKKDLSMRGPGSLFGTKQSGNDYFIKLMLNYPNMYERAKKEAKMLCQDATGEDMLRRFEELFVTNE